MVLKESSIKKIPSRPIDCAWTGIVYAASRTTTKTNVNLADTILISLSLHSQMNKTFSLFI